MGPHRLLVCASLLLACGDDTTQLPSGSGDASETGTSSASDISAGQTSAPTSTVGDATTGGTTTDATTGAAEDSTGAGPGGPSSEATGETTGVPAGCEEVNVPDALLSAELITALGLGVGPISGEFASTVEKLRVGGTGIADLTGLECFVHLKEFELVFGGEVTDLGPLSGLHALERVEIRSHKIADLQPLVGLEALRVLNVRKNAIVDLAPIAALTSLEELTIDGNPVTSFAPLAGHPALRTLDADSTQPADLVGLGQISQLELLELRSAGVTDLGPLVGLTGLVELQLYENEVADLVPLAGMKKLRRLGIYDNKLTDLAPLAGLPALEAVTVGHNKIVDPSPMAHHPALAILYLQENLITDVSALVDLPAITQLGLSDNGISDVTPLAQLTTLTQLELARNPLTKGIAGLEPLTALMMLDVTATGITDLAEIAPGELSNLIARDNAIVDLAPLAGHQKLGEVDLSNNEITTMNPVLAGSWWMKNGCSYWMLGGNALDATTVNVSLPTLCDENAVALSWDGGDCLSCDHN